ncbi:MAG: NAD(P)-binding domain-containing protein [Alphaproteobacteria bacterium]|jgi:4-hydroxybutyrate dehydrogenase/sulfolactaldehyde 3-reductase|nr:NAD(P)-binding domain-containing protein [Alphaproteobacteria bacterium]MDP6589405.1 NAD(P)-binding domain-containing protein [Alphaproteobacteria bacterium]MDP6818573.1 NAD(P)-binding domain-containing protein [Alphaproteobacteria bacterium]
MTERIGFIGLGAMGKGMASNLQNKGFQLNVFDIVPEPVAVLVQQGAKAAASVAELTEASDIVVTMLPGSPEVEAVVLGEGGVLAHGRDGMLLLDMSTVDPETTDGLARRLPEEGIAVVDAPVGRLAQHANSGESLFMVGASDEDFARVRPLLEAMGTTIHHCGAVGSGMRTKLVNNFLAIVSCQLNAEALTLSTRFGLDLQTTLDVIHGTTATNGQLKINYATKVLTGDTEPGFAIDLAHKDLTLIVNAANQAKVPLPIGAAARESVSLARSTSFHNKDFSALLDHWCERAGVKAPRL